MGLPTYGTMAVDWEERVRFDRLRTERLARISGLLAESSLGALLCFDMTNIRYITATHIGTWAQDKLNRFCLLPQHDEPIMWDFGSAARHHQLYNPWLARRPLARRHLDPARRDVPRVRPGRGRRGQDPRRARAARSARRAGRGRRDRAARAVRAAERGDRGRRRPAADAAGARDQDPRRDHAAQPGVRDGRRRLRGAVPRDEARDARERVRRPGQQGALRHGVGVRRGRQRDLGRALQPAPARVHRPRAPPRRPGLLRHPPQLHGLPHVLLPHVRGGERARARWSTPTSAAATTSTRRSS